MKNSLNSVTSEGNLPGYVIRSLNVGGGDYLVVAGSTAGIQKQNQHLALLVASAALVVALIGLVLAREVMRRDLRSMERLIDYAGDVAGGGDTGPAPPSEGSRDIRELRGALVYVVDALQERIAFEAQNANAMQQFIDDASHELRTPLTVVKGYNELLASGTASPEQQARAVSRVQREVDRMESLVRDLLLLAEVREAPQHPEQSVNLSELVTTSVSDFAFEHPERPLSSEVALTSPSRPGRTTWTDCCETLSLTWCAILPTTPPCECTLTKRAKSGRAGRRRRWSRPPRLRCATPAFSALRRVTLS